MLMAIRRSPLIPALLTLSMILIAAHAWGQGTSAPLDHLFGSRTLTNDDFNDLPQWLRTIHRHEREDRADRPELKEWFALLSELQGKPRIAQLQRVNAFINRKPYILDSVNYGVDDYWAVVREFMVLAGDCEDFSISKFFSLRVLGFAADSMRIVVLQDTNLGIAHAVLAVDYEGGALILDNQTDEIMTDKRIIHYTPLYSVNEQHWWLHLPPM